VISILATTSDDSFGESFDKVAKMMDLGYPGGEVIQNLAKSGDKNRFKFSVPLKYDKRLEYSFSGLKNQVRVQIANLGDLGEQDISDVAACFEETAVNHIIDKLEKIFDKFEFKNFGVVGGASANLNLRNKLEKLCSKFGSNLLYAPLKFCSDNAAMIARAGATKFKNGEFEDALTMQIHPRSNLELIRLK
ncbi:MAG: tRNA (adenosine(37)-N6)-threonylcarbamoyltransferase complex transferase subunit TsaD, partial [Campylobacter hyointestinalis]